MTAQHSGPSPSQRDAFEEAWKTIAPIAAHLDHRDTITARDHAAAAAAAGVTPPVPAPLPPPQIALSALPHLEREDFDITTILGEGGMGRVLLAHQRSLDRDVAVKTLKAEVAEERSQTALLAEAVITGSLEHPNIVPVHAVGRAEDGRPMLVMKRIEGVSWQALVKDPDHPMWSAQSPGGGDRLEAHLEILMAVCNAVHFAHCRGVIHRDIKLDNVMIGAFGEVYVVDWGIAVRAASPGEGVRRPGPLIGTLTYMAPEMVRGDLSRIDARTDVYLLGATLHAALTGKPRHSAETFYDALVSADESRPFTYGPEVHAELAAICNKAMSKRPADRFQSALELRRAVADYRRHRGSIALSEEASARLDEIRALVEMQAEGASPADARRLHGLLTECRFGFMQALRAWSDNAAAQAGLVSCLEEMIAHEIMHRDAGGARALYAELPAPRPELMRRIEALEAEQKEAEAREARLQAMERDLDLSLGARAQLGLITGMIVCALGIFTWLSRRGFQTTHRHGIVAGAVTVAGVLIAFAVLRRQLRSTISLRATGLLVLLPVAGLGHRILATLHGTDVPGIVAVDLWIGAVVAAAAGISLVPSMSWSVIPFVVGSIVVTLRPENPIPIFAGSMMSGFAMFILLWRRAARQKQQGL